MTRINSAIPVHRLTDEHLLAEHREIKRLPYCLKKSIEVGTINDVPDKFTLGKGHVKFFLDKQWFLLSRYYSIFFELKRRGFNSTDFSYNWNDLTNGKYWNWYEPTTEEAILLKERISDRIMNSKKKCWHYYKKEIGKEEAINLLQYEED